MAVQQRCVSHLCACEIPCAISLPSLSKSPSPRPSPQGTPEALPYPILHRLSRLRTALLRGAPAGCRGTREHPREACPPAGGCGRCGKKEFLEFLSTAEEPVLGRAREPPDDRSPYESRFDSEFAGILQLEIRQRVSGVCILFPSVCSQPSRGDTGVKAAKDALQRVETQLKRLPGLEKWLVD